MRMPTIKEMKRMPRWIGVRIQCNKSWYITMPEKLERCYVKGTPLFRRNLLKKVAKLWRRPNEGRIVITKPKV